MSSRRTQPASIRRPSVWASEDPVSGVSPQAMQALRVGYLLDEERWAALNGQGRNFWSAYLEEIFGRLGVTAKRIERGTLADPKALAGYVVICLGDLAARDLPQGALAALERWVRVGGVLIAYNFSGADALFGNEGAQVVPQGDDEFRISGYFQLARRRITQGIHSRLCPRQRLIAISPLRPVRPRSSAAFRSR